MSGMRTTLEFLGNWEKIYNPEFKGVEFDHFKMQAGLGSFVIMPGCRNSKSIEFEGFRKQDTLDFNYPEFGVIVPYESVNLIVAIK